MIYGRASQVFSMELQIPQMSLKSTGVRGANGQGQISQGNGKHHNPLRNADCTWAY